MPPKPPGLPVPAALDPCWRHLALLAGSELLAMSLWFSGSAVVPQLTAAWSLGPAARSWMTMSVQLGFVAGALASALLNLADRIPVPRLIAASALAAALVNAAVVTADGHAALAVALRFLTGTALAGVYPPGMKLVVTWFRSGRGLGISILIGALTIGSASPHLLNGLPVLGPRGMPPWPAVMLATSGLAALGGVTIALFVRCGPFDPGTAPFNWRFAGRTLADRPTRLANFGYLGHMWELYAMWTWAPIVLIASYQAGGRAPEAARVAGFAVIAAGAAGSVLAGWLADRRGRTTVAAASLAVSGACALTAGFLVAHPLALTAVCLVWGFAVVADSAQFSAAVSELTDPRYVGTALTMQTSLGFLLTLVTIRIVPPLAEAAGWSAAFMLLAAGPVFGAWSMLRLRGLPEAARMAGGRR